MKHKKIIVPILIQLFCLGFAYIKQIKPLYSVLHFFITHWFGIVYITSLLFLIYQLIKIAQTRSNLTHTFGHHIPTSSKTQPVLFNSKNNIVKNIFNFSKKNLFILAWLVFLIVTTIVDGTALYVFYGILNSPSSFSHATPEGVRAAKLWILSMIALYLTAFTGSIVVLIISATKSKILSNTKFKAIVTYSYIIIPIIFSILFFCCRSILPPKKIPSFFSGLVGLYCFATIKDTCVAIGESLDKEPGK